MWLNFLIGQKLQAVTEGLDAGPGTYVFNDFVYASLTGFIVFSTNEQGLVVICIIFTIQLWLFI